MTDDKKKIIGRALAKIVARAQSGFEPAVIGLMAAGGELGPAELLDGARLAQAEEPRHKVLAIGPRRPGYEDLDWLETGEGEADIAAAMEKALNEGRLQGAVALHYPFPLGVTTIGRVLTPARGRPLLLASTTGTAAAQTAPALVLNALYGRAVARSLGLAEPTLGLLNINGANQALRALTALGAAGYPVKFGASGRADGGALLRGNDLLNPGVDICLCDSLTGNVLMKLFSAWQTGGAYEALGWGYGPSTGAGWRRVISIISRASGAPVVAGALKFNAAVIRGGLAQKVAEETAAADKAGLAGILAGLAPAPPAAAEGVVKAPPARPTEEEIHGLDVLDIEAAVVCLWREGLYAESAMGCTGPVVKVPRDVLGAAKDCLKRHNYI
ncbi:MAG: glycine reductase [Candidatus Adiutrix sp.]|jgi:betaine reductase|nr:glycine reductase [Candidatus Adiutrix sp.]